MVVVVLLQTWVARSCVLSLEFDIMLVIVRIEYLVIAVAHL